MRWFNWLGVAVQVLGLLGAMFLLARLRETVTGREGALLRWGRASWRRLRNLTLRLLGHTPPPPTVRAHAGVAQGFGSLTAEAHGVTNIGPMPGGLALSDQVAYVDERVRQVEHKVNDLWSKVWRQANAQDNAVKAAREYAENEISKAVTDVRSEIRQLVGQDVGWEIGFLAAVAVGLVLAAL
jgi:tetrahydromethanopterin S-methyltransferase subunit G